MTDARAGLARLTAIGPALAARLAKEVADGAAELGEAVRRNLSGEVLNVRSGRLRDGIRVDVDPSSLGACARIASDAPYARIQEYGGRVDIPAIAPVAAKVLAFPFEGRIVFAAQTRAHTVEIPARPYLQPARDAFAPAFRSKLAAAVTEVLA